MTASATVYRSPFISQRRKDLPPYEDCVLESSLMLLGSQGGQGAVNPSPQPPDLSELTALNSRNGRNRCTVPGIADSLSDQEVLGLVA